MIGYQDEVWWSRFALPSVRLWSDEVCPARLHEHTRSAGDPDPQALACYGLWCAEQHEMFLRFVTGRPVSHVTTAFLRGVCAELWQRGQKVLVLIWDNASWHVSAEVREWIAGHNAAAKQRGEGIRILVVGLPTKSPWLNKIAPKWKHSKVALVERDRVLTAAEVEARVGAYFGTVPQPRLVQCVPAPEPAETAAGPVTKTKATRLGKPVQTGKTQQAA